MRPTQPIRYSEDPKIRQLRTISWYWAVRGISQRSHAELEMEFSGRVGRHTSGLWGKYRRGEVVPRQGQSSNGRLNIIEQVEASYPGTADWFRWPLWRLLDPAPLGMEEIRGYYQDRTIFPDDVAAMVLLERPERGFWREDFEVGDVCWLLVQRGLAGLPGLLTLIREAKIIQDRYQYALGLEWLLRLAKEGEPHWPYFGPRHRRRMTQLLTTRWSRLGPRFYKESGFPTL